MSTATSAIVDLDTAEEEAAPRLFTKRNVERFLSVISPIILLLLWQFGASVGWIDTRFFPSPAAIFEEAYAMILSGELWTHFSISLQRIVIGYIPVLCRAFSSASRWVSSARSAPSSSR